MVYKDVYRVQTQVVTKTTCGLEDFGAEYEYLTGDLYLSLQYINYFLFNSNRQQSTR